MALDIDGMKTFQGNNASGFENESSPRSSTTRARRTTLCQVGPGVTEAFSRGWTAHMYLLSEVEMLDPRLVQPVKYADTAPYAWARGRISLAG